MGNNQSNVLEGLQFCSSNADPLAKRFMVDKDFRVDFSRKRNIEKELTTWSKRKNDEVSTKHPHIRELRMSQQPVHDGNWQQQTQEEFCDFTVPAKLQKGTPKIKVEAKEKNVTENNERFTFDGIFGDVDLNKDHVSYMDSSGEEFNETFSPESLQKTFPMGISFGGLTKSLWFKDITNRDACFKTMTGYLPPSYDAVMSNPSFYNIPNENQSVCFEEKDKVKVFDGIGGNDVIVCRNGPVSYTDINGVKHCVSYNRINIQKCFPHGICFGGLSRTIWLKDEIERDLCYILMQMVGETGENKEQDEEKTFLGIYGSVVLRSDYEVEYTSLVGDRVITGYDPRAIRTVFPMGVTGGGLPTTIWFRDMEVLDNCITTMRQDV